MPTFYEPLHRKQYFLDGQKRVTWTKSSDEINTYDWDLTDELASGETVSSVATDVSGVTLNSGSLASPVYTLTVTGTEGSIRMTATLSTGRVLERDFIFVDKPQRNPDRNDYEWST